jgi:uncharacterized protein
MSPLSSDDRRLLLLIARKSIVEAVILERSWRPAAHSGAMGEHRGAFVTLSRRERLRGCVGQPLSVEPLFQTVARCAVLAAREDLRFAPVTPREVAELTIEISILSPMEPIEPERIEIGRHGLWIEAGSDRGLLLPQVAIEHGFTRERFLAEACEKAGLSPEAWKLPEAKILAFTAEVFSEREFGLGVDSTVEPLGGTARQDE